MEGDTYHIYDTTYNTFFGFSFWSKEQVMRIKVRAEQSCKLDMGSV